MGRSVGLQRSLRDKGEKGRSCGAWAAPGNNCPLRARNRRVEMMTHSGVSKRNSGWRRA